MLKPSTYRTFIIEEEMIHHLMLQTVSIKRNGLFYGKLGIAIAFFEYGKYRHNPIYTDYAKELKDSLPQKIEDNISLDFATGLCGFGWGIEYMVQHQFIDSDSAKVCADIDQRIMTMNMRRMTNLSLENGLEGFLHYILIRIKGAKMRGNPIPFDNVFLKDTYDSLISLNSLSVNAENVSNGLKQAFISYMDTGLLFYQPDISLFISDLEIKNEEDILSAKLGLSDGLAGKLVKIVYEQKSLPS